MISIHQQPPKKLSSYGAISAKKINVKVHTISLLNSATLIAMSAWGYGASESPSITALIPLFFGLMLVLCYQGLKMQNKVTDTSGTCCIAHAAKRSYRSI